jgi:hypothetical protein
VIWDSFRKHPTVVVPCAMDFHHRVFLRKYQPRIGIAGRVRVTWMLAFTNWEKNAKTSSAILGALPGSGGQADSDQIRSKISRRIVSISLRLKHSYILWTRGHIRAYCVSHSFLPPFLYA